MYRYHGRCHRGSMTQVLRDLIRQQMRTRDCSIKEVLGEMDLVHTGAKSGFDVLRWEWKTLQDRSQDGYRVDGKYTHLLSTPNWVYS